MKLAWTRTAAAERREIRAYIAQDNPTAALALDELFTEKAARLVEHPSLGRPGRVSGTREPIVQPNYLLIYDVDGDLVRILSVLHAAKLWPPMRE